jgi:hypothetical protein
MKNVPQAKLAAAVLASCLLASAAVRAESPVLIETAPAVAYVTITDVIVTEGDSGQTAFSTTVSTYGAPGTFTVKIVATPGTARESDYLFPDTVVTLSYTSGLQTISGSIVGDLEFEGDEYFTLTAVLVSDGGSLPIISTGGKVTIKDDDQARDYRLYVDGISVSEGGAGYATIHVPVRLEPAAPGVVTVSYATADKTATSVQDYLPTSGQLIFAAGEASQLIPVEIVGDELWEMDETFAVVLSEPSGARLGTAGADVTIINDDPAAVPNIAGLTVDEGNVGTNEVVVTVAFDRPVPDLAMLWYQLLDGGAVAGQDFRTAGTTLYPQPGVWQMTFPVEILPDTEPECDEGFFIRYGGYYGIDEATRSARILIRDDDGPVAGCGDPFATAPPPELPDGGGAETLPPELGVDAGAGPDTSGSPMDDAGTSMTAETGATLPATPQMRAHSGCECSMAGGSAVAPLVVLACLAIMLVHRRRRRRPR